MLEATQTVTSATKESPITVAARLAPEGIRPKEFIAVLNHMIELPSFLWCCSSSLLPHDELVQLRMMSRDPGKPFKVTSVCLPFVYARDINDKLVAFDTRQHQLVRLDSKVGRTIWKRLRKAHKPA